MAETDIDKTGHEPASRDVELFAHDTASKRLLLSPTVLLVIFLSVVPLLFSGYLALSRFRFVRGGFEVNFIGFDNFEKLLVGSQQRRFVGNLEQTPWWAWALIALFVAAQAVMAVQAVRRSPGHRVRTAVLRMVVLAVTAVLVYVAVRSLTGEGIPGTLVVTLVFVFLGVALQYFLGLGLALVAAQQLRGRRLFRTLYLIPMIVTPVGAAFLFRMVTDTSKGPLEPLWKLAFGDSDFTWVNEPWPARIAIVLADTWQWTPFMFVILLAAVESLPPELTEAAKVDGARAWSQFWLVTFPQLIPVSLTLVLIRSIEAFKIVDLPQVLTGGGPGTATESLSLQALLEWRAVNLGGSAALAYVLLFVTTFVALLIVNYGRRRAVARFT
ncbi:MAG: sugar ABC transporter permease [Acidimicrobiaceae bacterium]|nr:sugar ABC transporter permease [Acidimicrobiaceae bacterium]MCY4279865.1 sugar ABC transporter permease [Acidimicrobiaceae bacterium]MCY4293258.1 sugar ABC transporter permease [Acidimicrobiaceae bacterium]